MPSREPESFTKPPKRDWSGCLTRIVIAILLGLIVGYIKDCNRRTAIRNAMNGYHYSN